MKERRRAERIDAELKLELRLPGMPNAALGRSVNISNNGIYFKSEYFMEEGTRLPMRIDLAEEKNPERGAIVPEGIVVRCTPEEEAAGCSEYSIACFFMELSEEDVETLDAFIADHKNTAEQR